MSIALTELNTSIEYAFPMLAVRVIIIGAFSREKALVFKSVWRTVLGYVKTYFLQLKITEELLVSVF